MQALNNTQRDETDIYSSTVDLRRTISDLVRSLRSLSIVLLHNLVLGITVHELPDDLDSRGRTAGLSSEHLAGLVHDEDATSGARECLLHANGRDERLLGVAQECVGQLLLGLEGGVCLWTVVGEAVDAVAGGGEGLVGVTEEASLLGACRALLAGKKKKVHRIQRTSRS
jgi:hypothetical protein